MLIELRRAIEIAYLILLVPYLIFFSLIFFGTLSVYSFNLSSLLAFITIILFLIGGYSLKIKEYKYAKACFLASAFFSWLTLTVVFTDSLWHGWPLVLAFVWPQMIIAFYTINIERFYRKPPELAIASFFFFISVTYLLFLLLFLLSLSGDYYYSRYYPEYYYSQLLSALISSALISTLLPSLPPIAFGFAVINKNNRIALTSILATLVLVPIAAVLIPTKPAPVWPYSFWPFFLAFTIFPLPFMIYVYRGFSWPDKTPVNFANNIQKVGSNLTSKKSTYAQTVVDFPSDLLSKYQPLEFLGEGGFAKVFKVKRKKDGKIVALKIPRMDGNTSKAFLREIGAWMHLDHPKYSQAL